MSTDKRKNSQRFGEWYGKNRKVLSEKRKKRYAEDPEYRKEVRARAREYRESLQHRELPEDPWQDYVLKEGRVVYLPSAVARIVGRSMSTLKLWEHKSWIPPVTDIPGEHRSYTRRQVELIKRLVEFTDKYPNRQQYEVKHEFQILLTEIQTEWGH